MLVKTVGPNFVTTLSALIMGYFRSTSSELILTELQEVTCWNFFESTF
jgi:hypothetical protein